MKLTLHKTTWIAALNATFPAAGTDRGNAASSPGAKIVVRNRRASVTTTNGAISIREIVAAPESQDGEVLIPATTLRSYVAAMPDGPVTLTFEANKATVTAGATTMPVPVIDIATFPTVTFPTEEGVVMEAARFVAALTQVTPSASTDQARQVLTGVLLKWSTEGFEVVATDSTRLAKKVVAGDSVLPDGTTIVAPAKELAAAGKLIANSGTVNVFLGTHALTLSTPERRVMVRLIQGSYPHYAPVLAGTENTVALVAKADLVAAVHRGGMVSATDGGTAVKVGFNVEAGTVTISAAGGNTPTIDELVAKISGENITLGFNATMLEQVIGQIDSTLIRVSFDGATRPVRFTDELAQSGLTQVLMPVRI